MRQRLVFFLIPFFFISSCKESAKHTAQEIEKDLQQIAKSIVPDKRVAIADIELVTKENGEKLKVLVKSNLNSVIDSVRGYIRNVPTKLDTTFTLLPNKKALESKIHAVVNISVANIRSQPKHSAELATQATLGTPLKVLEKNGSWYRVQTPDNYISWVDEGGIVRLTPDDYYNWLKHEKVIITKPLAYTYELANTTSQLVSDLTGGNVLKILNKADGFYKVEFPDKRQGFVEVDNAQIYEDWIAGLSPTPENLVKVGKQMLGVPYLWGGTSFKGVDCSGFTKTIYFMNGMVIPRDASQQVHAGNVIDTSEGFDDLKPGDLLFFGRKATQDQAEKVIHVGMWIGNNEFIHASGRVRINSFDSNASNYNEYELNRFLRAKRFLNQPQELITQLENKALFYIDSE